MIIEPLNKAEVTRFLTAVLELGVEFKLQDQVQAAALTPEAASAILRPLPANGTALDEILAQFRQLLLPYCVNVAAPGYMSYPYVGNSVAAVAGEILDPLLQQNLMNQEWSPSATLAEITVLQWFRDALGFDTCYAPRSVYDVGGAITAGGTASNTIALLLARERRFPGTMTRGVFAPGDCGLIVPAGVWHHTIAGAKKWIGCGADLIEVATDRNFRMDPSDLRAKLAEHHGRIMAVVAYAGNSKTMTIDDLGSIADITRQADPRIWLHVDACFGFSLAFSDDLRSRLSGIELFDSVTADPHKVLNVPYPLSVFMVRDPADLGLLFSPGAIELAGGDLSLGLITPFFGSRPWMALKAWFALKNYGRDGLAELIEDRCRTAAELARTVAADDELILIGEPDVNAVLFYFSGERPTSDVARLNRLSASIRDELSQHGEYQLHRPKLRDPGIFCRGALLRPLRYMSGNQRVTRDHLAGMIQAVKEAGRRFDVCRSTCE